MIALHIDRVFDPAARSDLPAPPAWSQDAACVGIPTDMFFPENSQNAHHGILRICQGCPVRQTCLDVALEDVTLVGVWGGTTPVQRRRLRRGRAIAPPLQPVTHGTAAGARAHYRRGEKACQECREASARVRRENTQRKRTA